MSTDGELCFIRLIDGEFYESGRKVLMWDPENDPDGCDPRGIATCPECDADFWRMMKAAADARARCRNGRVEQ
jgi:hypothetical protein